MCNKCDEIIDVTINGNNLKCKRGDLFMSCNNPTSIIRKQRTDCDCPPSKNPWGIGIGGWCTCGICGVSYIIDPNIALQPLEIYQGNK